MNFNETANQLAKIYRPLYLMAHLTDYSWEIIDVDNIVAGNAKRIAADNLVSKPGKIQFPANISPPFEISCSERQKLFQKLQGTRFGFMMDCTIFETSSAITIWVLNGLGMG